MSLPHLPSFVGQREAARLFGLHPRTLRERIRRGELESFRSPLDDRKLLVRTRDLLALREPRPVTAKEAIHAS